MKITQRALIALMSSFIIVCQILTVSAAPDIAAGMPNFTGTNSVYFGVYPQQRKVAPVDTENLDARENFEVSPVRWLTRTNDNSNRQLTLFSYAILDWAQMRETAWSRSNWFNSSMRKWLNNLGTSHQLFGPVGTSFLTTAFPRLPELEAINITEWIKPSSGIATGILNGDPDTYDRVFLLPSANLGTAIPTDFARDSRYAFFESILPIAGLNNVTAPNSTLVETYWTRTVGSSGSEVGQVFMAVGSNGNLTNTSGGEAAHQFRGVRPAVNLDKDAVLFAHRISANTGGNPALAPANTFYVAGTTDANANYKLTIIDYSIDIPKRVVSSVSAFVGSAAAVPLLNIEPGEPVAYKIVNESGALAGFDITTVNSSRQVEVKTSGLNNYTSTSVNLTAETYKLYIWKHIANAMDSNYGSFPVMLNMTVN